MKKITLKKYSIFDCPGNKDQHKQRHRAFFQLPWNGSLLCVFWIYLKNTNNKMNYAKARAEKSLFTWMLLCTSVVSHLKTHIEGRGSLFFPLSHQRAPDPVLTRGIWDLVFWFIWKAVIGQLQTPFKTFLWYLKAYFYTKGSAKSFLKWISSSTS